MSTKHGDDSDRRRRQREAQQMNALSRAQRPTISLVTGPDGTFETWSPALPELIGLADDQVPLDTRGWLDLVHPDDRAFFRATCIKAGARHRSKDIRYRLRLADGRVIDLRQIMKPLDRHAQGRWAHTLWDVTALDPGESASQAREPPALNSLSRRERQVFQLVAEGRSATQIAKLLSLSPRTVETYRSRLYKKLELKDARALILFALKQGIIS